MVSDWVSGEAKEGKLWIYNLKKHSLESMPFGQSPADIFYDTSSHKIYAPQMLIGKLYIENIDSLKRNK